MTVKTSIQKLDPEFVRLAESANLDAQVLAIIPDSIRDYDGELTALFRIESQDLRAIGTQRGIDVRLLTPVGAKLATRTERADAVILPFVISLSTQLIANVLTPYVEALIDKWKETGSRKPDVVYRRGEWKPDGSIERVDITGDASSILKLLKEESETGDERP